MIAQGKTVPGSGNRHDVFQPFSLPAQLPVGDETNRERKGLDHGLAASQWLSQEYNQGVLSPGPLLQHPVGDGPNRCSKRSQLI